MNLRERLAFAIRALRGRPGYLVRSGVYQATAREHEGEWTNDARYLSFANEYAASSWVYAAVTRISEAAALVPVHVYRRSGEKDTPLRDHAMETLLNFPNEFTSRFELFETTFAFLELAGNAYWFLAGDGQGGAPKEVWPLRPDRVTVVSTRERLVAGYVYDVTGEEVRLLPEEVIHFKRFAANDDLYGLSPLEAAYMASSTDRTMGKYNRNFLGNDRALPAGALVFKERLTDDEFKRVQREFLESFSGSERRTAFIRGAGEVEWHDMGLSQREMDFIESRRMNKEEILSVYGIPLGLYERDATRANADVARRTFYEGTIWPNLVRFTQKLTQQLCPFYGRGLVIEPEEIRDAATDAQAIATARGILTVNEIRQKFYGMGPVAGGDDLASNASRMDLSPDSSRVDLTPDPSHVDLTPYPSPQMERGGKQAREELDRWERWAVNRVGKVEGRRFATRGLGQEVVDLVQKRLTDDLDAAGIADLFKAASRML